MRGMYSGEGTGWVSRLGRKKMGERETGRTDLDLDGGWDGTERVAFHSEGSELDEGEKIRQELGLVGELGWKGRFKFDARSSLEKR